MRKQNVALLTMFFLPIAGQAHAEGEIMATCLPKKMGYYERIDLLRSEGKLYLSLTARPARPLGTMEVSVSSNGHSQTYLAKDPAEQNFSLEIPLAGEASFVRYDFRGGVVEHEFSCATAEPSPAK